jgi:hypothetical protein
VIRRLTHPDLYIKIEDEVAEDDLVVLRWRATGATHETPGTTGCLRCCSGISVIRLLAGRQVDAFTALAPNPTAA